MFNHKDDESIRILYEDIYHESRQHGNKKALINLIKTAIKKGLVRVEDTRKGYMVKSLVDNSQYLTHKGEKGFHDLRRYLQRLDSLVK